jgi:hypothetical protein
MKSIAIIPTYNERENVQELIPLIRKEVRQYELDILVVDSASPDRTGDAVIGMMSIALLEAAVSGRPALSVEIGLLESGAEEPCISNLLVYTFAVYKREALRQALIDICKGNLAGVTTSRKVDLRVHGAARRTAAVVLQQ